MNELLSITEEELNKIVFERPLCTFYSDNQIVRALVQMVPTFGPLIDVFLAMPGSKYKDQRIQFFTYLVYTSIKELEKHISNEQLHRGIEWTASEQFQDTLYQALDSTIKTRSREKIVMNVMILTNLLSVHNDGRFRPEEYLNSIEQLTTLEISILLTFFKCYVNEPQKSEENELQWAGRIGIKNKLIQELRINNDDLTFLLTRLERTGFIKEITGVYLDYSGGSYTITRSLIRMMEYLSLHPFSKVVI
jgi:hypothetical protein